MSRKNKNKDTLIFAENELSMVLGLAQAVKEIAREKGFDEDEIDKVQTELIDVSWEFKRINYKNVEIDEDSFNEFAMNFLGSKFFDDEKEREGRKVLLDVQMCDLNKFPSIRDGNMDELIKGILGEDLEVRIAVARRVNNFTSEEFMEFNKALRKYR